MHHLPFFSGVSRLLARGEADCKALRQAGPLIASKSLASNFCQAFGWTRYTLSIYGHMFIGARVHTYACSCSYVCLSLSLPLSLSLSLSLSPLLLSFVDPGLQVALQGFKDAAPKFGAFRRSSRPKSTASEASSTRSLR